jgi:1,4-alpha-glucan branching enzyme
MSEKVQPKHLDMGAVPGTNGVTFRVWAPHAERVYVTGTFNGWGETATPLVKEENGY